MNWRKLKKYTHYNYLRRKLHLRFQRKKLKNKNFTIITNNCIGGSIYHDLGLRFDSPFINLKLSAADFLLLLKNFDHYINLELKPISDKTVPYPLGNLGGLIIHFVHYQTFEQAKYKWDERKKRINHDNLFIIFTDREGCTLEIMKEFDNLQYKNKIIFTNKQNLDIASNVYVPGFDDQDSVGRVMDPIKGKPYLKYYNYIDIVRWFNCSTIKRNKILILFRK